MAIKLISEVKSDLVIFIAYLNSLISNGNTINSNILDWREIIPILISFFDFPANLPYDARYKIVVDAVRGIRGPKLSTTDLLVQINHNEAQFLQQPTLSFYFITTISLNQWTKLNGIRIKGCTIHFGKKYTWPMKVQRDELLASKFIEYQAEQEKSYLSVRVRVKARSPQEAVNLAINALNLVRGIWNLYLNRAQASRITFGKTSPVNKIITGKYHTLHYLNGDPVPDIAWYEQLYQRIMPVNVEEEILRNMDRFLLRTRRQLNGCPFRNDLEQLIIRYCEALDTPDLERAVLNQWSALEQIFKKNIWDNHSVVVNRAAWLDPNVELSKAVLNSIRFKRNDTIHMSTQMNDSEIFAFHIKRFVENGLNYLLLNGSKFDSIIHAIDSLKLKR